MRYSLIVLSLPGPWDRLTATVTSCRRSAQDGIDTAARKVVAELSQTGHLGPQHCFAIGRQVTPVAAQQQRLEGKEHVEADAAARRAEPAVDLHRAEPV